MIDPNKVKGEVRGSYIGVVRRQVDTPTKYTIAVYHLDSGRLAYYEKGLRDKAWAKYHMRFRLRGRCTACGRGLGFSEIDATCLSWGHKILHKKRRAV